MSKEQRCELPLNNLVNNIGEDYKFPTQDDGTLTRDLLLEIRLVGDQFEISPWGGADLSPQEGSWRTELGFGRTALFGWVEACRAEWMKHVVEHSTLVPQPDGSEELEQVFLKYASLEQLPHVAEEVGPALAIAGRRLFRQVFRVDGKMTRLGKRLMELSRERPLAINVLTEEFFLPWGLLYVHPDKKKKLKGDGSNFSWEGFWGYRHVVEQNPEYGKLSWALKTNGAQKLLASVNIDERVDEDLEEDLVSSQLKFFDEQERLDITERRDKEQLRVAISDEEFADQIVYFFCHGTLTGTEGNDKFRHGAIVLSDDERIVDADIGDWRIDAGGTFTSNPLVFINACEQGQMQSIYYDGLGLEFLRQKAVGVIGPQIEVPTVFAEKYARRLFKLFLEAPKKPADPPPRLGPLMRELTVHFIEKKGNPLGLIYSLYRGTDCFVQPPELPEQQVETVASS